MATKTLFKMNDDLSRVVIGNLKEPKPAKGLVLDTPVEEHTVKGRSILVKRDDLMGDNKKLPPWGKLRSVQTLLDHLVTDRPLIHLNVFGSWSGWALAGLVKTVPVYIVYPKTKKITSDCLGKMEEVGATLIPVRHNMMRVLYSQTGNIAEEKGYQRLPYAFQHHLYISSMATRLYNTVKELNEEGDGIDNLVVSAGSGVTVAGLTKAFLKASPKGKVIAVCVSSESSVQRVINKWHDERSASAVTVIKSEYDFDDPIPKLEVPFSCNQHWDKKAWDWWVKNGKTLKGRTLFWNLGGLNTWV